MFPSRRKRKWLVRGTLLLLAVALGWFLIFTGPRNLERYPPAAQSPYRLPWPAGVRHLCCQSNRGVISHRGWEEFAYDFEMSVGSDVCAARAGVVSDVVTEHDGNGLNAPNNVVMISHADETFALYAHIRKDGSYVKLGETVVQGQRIAASGNVGRSTLPHLHFAVMDKEGNLLPVTFVDVESDRGIPRMFKGYTSGNRGPE
jgi:murein DD-endopeptidase MepM/ murein hydrolase activator NlpD